MSEEREIIYSQISDIAEQQFSDIVVSCIRVKEKLRLFLIDGSFMDIWLSKKRIGAYGYHWERGMIDGTIYRYNNFPDSEARGLKTFPKHFHERDKKIVKESYISDDPEEAIREFLEFARKVIKQKK